MNLKDCRFFIRKKTSQNSNLDIICTDKDLTKWFYFIKEGNKYNSPNFKSRGLISSRAVAHAPGEWIDLNRGDNKFLLETFRRIVCNDYIELSKKDLFLKAL